MHNLDNQGKRWTANRHYNDYYPTPNGVASDIAQYISTNYRYNFHNILDIGAGHGVFGQELAPHLVYKTMKGIELDKQFSKPFPYTSWLNEDYNLMRPDKKYQLIIGNPPYVKNLNIWVKKAINSLSEDGLLVWLLRTEYMGGQKRYKDILSKYQPLEVVQLVGRVCFTYPNLKASANFDSAVFIWGSQENNKTELNWLRTRNEWDF